MKITRKNQTQEEKKEAKKETITIIISFRR